MIRHHLTQPYAKLSDRQFYNNNEDCQVKKLLLLTILGTTLTSASAAILFGVPDCGEWVKGNQLFHQRWLTGYMSGLNAGIHSKGKLDPFDGVSVDQMILWMDNYCKATPLSDLNEGGNSLYTELENKAKGKSKR